MQWDFLPNTFSYLNRNVVNTGLHCTCIYPQAVQLGPGPSGLFFPCCCHCADSSRRVRLQAGSSALPLLPFLRWAGLQLGMLPPRLACPVLQSYSLPTCAVVRVPHLLPRFLQMVSKRPSQP